VVKGYIYPAGICAVWQDMDDAVRQWSRHPRGCSDDYLVTKWNRFREALFELEARADTKHPTVKAEP
jgi:hypothetical protein